MRMPPQYQEPNKELIKSKINVPLRTAGIIRAMTSVKRGGGVGKRGNISDAKATSLYLQST
jgi:hypothetical protein